MQQRWTFRLFIGAFLFQVISLSGQTISYQPSDEDFPNPERGFMHFTETSSLNYSPLDAATMASWRNPHQPDDAAYSITTSLVFRIFYLENFKNGAISSAYLNAVQADFEAARQAGMKLVIRFAYTQKSTPPFGDAPKNVVLQHIAQLKPILIANADVIAVMQMGFIGAWGEGYYTDYFGYGSLSAQNWSDRIAVVNALLDALPAERQVQVRVPQTKQKVVYGVNASPNSAPLTVSEAWQNTAKARIGFFNDCFLASSDDFGTYSNYDLNASGCDTCAFKPYFSQDSRYVAVGGETCSDWDPYSNCTMEPGGGAQQEMARMHWSYLNANWNNDVNNDWVSGGCIEEIRKRLGYRLEMVDAELTTEAQPGQSIIAKINLKNTGFAAPFNDHKIRLLLRNTLTHEVWFSETPDNPRYWLPGPQTYSIQHFFCVPQDMPKGTYEWLLQIADPSSSLADRPEYAIRMANQDTWEPATGYNRLLQTLVIKDTANQFTCNGQDCFQPLIPTLPSAAFYTPFTSGCIPFACTFFNQTSSCWSYAWIFLGGNPETSNESNPTINYDTPGDYPVSLTVTNAAGLSANIKQNYIHVGAVPVAGFGYSPNNLLINFSNFSLYATEYFWDFGDGSQSNLKTPAHQYLIPGTYTVTLTAYSSCGMHTITKTIVVSCPAQSVQIHTDNPPIICDGASITIFATPGFEKYHWYRFGTDLFAITTVDSVAVNLSGPYSVKAVDAAGCESSSNVIQITSSVSPFPAFTYTANGLSVKFKNNSVFSIAYHWDFGDGSPGSDEKEPTHLFPAPGTYQVSLEAESQLCGWKTLTKIITLTCGTPAAELSASANPFCEGDSIVLRVSGGNFDHYSWYRSGEWLPLAHEDSLIVAEGGQYQVEVELGGCPAQTNELILEKWPAPEAQISSSSNLVCEGDVVTILGAGGDQYWWTVPGGGISTGQSLNFIAEAINAGGYHLKVIDQHGCTDTAGLFLAVHPPPQPVINPSGPVYLNFGDTVVLYATGSYANWMWSTGGDSLQVAGAGCSIYSVTVSDQWGCQGVSAPVEVYTLPLINFDNGVLTATPAEGYQWFVDGQAIPGANSQSYTPAVSGLYYVETTCNAVAGFKSNERSVIISGTYDLQGNFICFYPNPMAVEEDWLALHFSNHLTAPATLHISDPAGKEILRQSGGDMQEVWYVNISALRQGSFVIQLEQEGKLSTLGILFRQ